MPKKKIQHKGKPKHATEQSEDYVFRKNNDENTEEEYTTVVDYETNRKYNKRLIESNWSKYDTEPSDVDSRVEESEPPKTNDLSYLIEMASSDCAHFEFRSEKLWRTENNSVPASKIFNLDLNLLSNGLACVPFHERVGLSESELSEEDKQKFVEAAENSRKEYNSIREKLMKTSEQDARNTDVESEVRTLDESVKDKLSLGVENEGSGECMRTGDSTLGEKSMKETELKNKNSDKGDKNKQSLFFSEKDENLEDWLDSVLDD